MQSFDCGRAQGFNGVSGLPTHSIPTILTLISNWIQSTPILQFHYSSETSRRSSRLRRVFIISSLYVTWTSVYWANPCACDPPMSHLQFPFCLAQGRLGQKHDGTVNMWRLTKPYQNQYFRANEYIKVYSAMDSSMSGANMRIATRLQAAFVSQNGRLYIVIFIVLL